MMGRIPEDPQRYLGGLNILGQPLWTPAGPNGFADTDAVIGYRLTGEAHQAFCEVISLGPGSHVAPGRDMPDLKAGDICITADIPLAARCIERQASALHSNGKPFTTESIGMALAMRDLMQSLREAGDIKGTNPPFTKDDRSRFLRALEEIIQLRLRKR